ncbi:MFS transporter [Nocardiopsis exhalans]|uniref:MFS transporter n=1 Tax=Nocardiopsis exhalans TaxID=163604 RepID=A0ABY5DHM1_9ACTN|nr:MFS transporter [Nocardiopsis exhalans]USY22885.1 MFS transporter [Nocardiopsis exhalans]
MPTTTGTTAGVRDVHAYQRGAWRSLLVVCLGMMMTFVNITATFGALASIQRDLALTPTAVVWVTSAYSLAVASLVLSAGTLGDALGRRAVFVAGVTLMGLGSLGAYLSDSALPLISAQAVMGAGGALVLPNSLALAAHPFREPHRRTQAISAWVACSGLGLAAGPVVAGALIALYTWHEVFLINVVLAVVVLALTPFLVLDSRQPGRTLDVPGLVLGALTVTALTYAVIEGGEAGYASAWVLTAYTVFAFALAGFVAVELRRRDPMLDLGLFRSASFSTVMVTGAAAMFAFTGAPMVLVLYLDRVQQVSALGVGLRVLPLFCVYILVSLLAARVVRRFGFRVTLTTGLLVCSAGTLLLYAWFATGAGVPLWAALSVIGLGGGLTLAPTTAAAVAGVEHDRGGMASATVNMFRQFGAVLGVSVLGTVLAVTGSYTLTLLIPCVLMAVTAVGTAALVEGRLGR